MRTSFPLLLWLVPCCASPHLSAAEMAGSPPKRLAVASREPRTLVTIDGVELAVHDSDPSSSKPIIFCLHAIGHGGADFTAFEAAFANTHRIITVDWPGQGASGPDAKPVDAQRYTELFTALVDKLQAKRIVILGNSIGGSVAIRYAAAHPENTRALMLCDSAGLDENPGGFIPSLFIGHIAGKMHDGAEGDPDFKAWFRDYYSKILITPEAAAERDAIVESAYEIAPVLAQAWDSFKRSDSDVRDLARRLQMPVFVGWAKNDDLIRWSRNQEAIEQIPHVEVHMFEAGHSAFLETPGPFNDAARKFLDALN